ncbi:PQQ-binding-like beta-propeller repeat protein [Limnospira platensis]|uniref:outer membrane protein assembly factor BamB family protein n=1 Tax=Limnospira platensis TaxID=118562 RepID=UPI0033937AC8
MISYYEVLNHRSQRRLSEPEVKAILETVLIQLVPLHSQGKAHQKISLQTLQQEGQQTILLLKHNPNVSGSPTQDIYDLGLVALELLTGQVPSPRRRHPDWDWDKHCLISDQLNAILEQMVTPNPDLRWQNASQVLSAMGVVVPATRPPLKLWQWGLVGAATTLVLVVGGLAIGSQFIPALRTRSPSAIWSWQMQRDGATMFRGNLERTGVYPPGGPTELTQLVWRFSTQAAISSSPAVSEGIVYFGSWDRHLYALDANTGQERWRFRTQAVISSSPAVSEGIVYFGSHDGNLYALDANTGQERWRFRTQAVIGSSPAVSEGIVYFGSHDNYLYALDANTGQERWRFRTQAVIGSSPAVSAGVVYFGSHDNHLYALDVNTGQERWRFRTQAVIDSSPAVSAGVVYFGSYDNHLYALDVNTGQERWKFRTENWIGSSPAVSGGVVYFGSGDNHLYAVK